MVPASQNINFFVRSTPLIITLKEVRRPGGAPIDVALVLRGVRLRFLQHCQACGSPCGTLRRVARELLAVIDQLNPRPEGAVSYVVFQSHAGAGDGTPAAGQNISDDRT
jgi:hypothetical protein